FSTRMLYTPGCMEGRLYTPASLLRTERVALVSTLVAVIRAIGTAAPLASVNLPVISPSVWLNAITAKHTPMIVLFKYMEIPFLIGIVLLLGGSLSRSLRCNRRADVKETAGETREA